jgi:hypothetical protein
MASYALVPVLSGFTCDLTRGELGFAPVGAPRRFRCLWSTGTAWGTYRREGREIALELCGGSLTLERVADSALRGCRSVACANASGTLAHGAVVFSQPLRLKAGDTLRLRWG